MENNSTFSRSVAAQQAALTVIEAAQKGEFINGPVFTAPELADAEKELMLKILTAVADKRRRDGTLWMMKQSAPCLLLSLPEQGRR